MAAMGSSCPPYYSSTRLLTPCILYLIFGSLFEMERPCRLKAGPPMIPVTRRNNSFTSPLLLLLLSSSAQSFSPSYTFISRHISRLHIFAPPGSGYAQPQDEESALPSTYEPMMEYPGTMRPGRTPENMPFHDLPIGDKDPDPVPWPHFQQIEWHHQWEPPHEHPIPMEEFIEMNGRWATPEMEAAMRAGVRRDVRERREQEEEGQRDMIITDDDDDDDFESPEEPVSLGEGVFGQLGSDADRAQTAVATSPDRVEKDEETDDFFDDEGLDDFLLDLGLDAEDDDKSTKSRDTSKKTKDTAGDEFDEEDQDDDEPAFSGKGVTASIEVDDDEDLGLGLDDDDDLEDSLEVPLEDDLGSDTLAGEDIFDEGGFDFDNDFDGGDTDMW